MASLWTRAALGVLVLACLGTGAILPAPRTGGPPGGCSHQRGLVMLQARRLARLAASNRRLLATTERLCTTYDPGNKSGDCATASGDRRRPRAAENAGTPGLTSTLRVNGDWRHVEEMPGSAFTGGAMADPPAVGNGTRLAMLQEESSAERIDKRMRKKVLFLKRKLWLDATLRQDQRVLVEAMRASFLEREGGLKEYAEMNWADMNPCNWTGLTCHLTQNTVSKLVLDFRNITQRVAPLPTTVVNITSVKILKILGGTLAGFDEGWEWTSASKLATLWIEYPGPINLPNMTRLVHLQRVKLGGIRPAPQVNIFRMLPKGVQSLSLSDLWLPEHAVSMALARLTLQNTNVRSVDVTGVRVAVTLLQNRSLRRLHNRDTGQSRLGSLVITDSPLLTDLPHFVRRYRLLHTIHIERCGLDHIDLDRLPARLTKLIVPNNRIRSINGTLAVMPKQSPRTLDFSNNLLKEMDLEVISRLTPRWLLLANNSIESDPYLVTSKAARKRLRTSLEIADCRGNPFCVLKKTYHLFKGGEFVLLGLFCPAWLDVARELKKTGYLNGLVSLLGSLRDIRNPCAPGYTNRILQSHITCGFVKSLSKFVTAFHVAYDARNPRALPNLSTVARIPTLRSMTVQNFKELAEIPPPLKKIPTLNLSGCSITHVPVWLLQSSRIERINLSDNPISEIGDLPNNEVTARSRIRDFVLRNTHLVEIPESLGLLPYLQHLFVDNNRGLRSLELGTPNWSLLEDMGLSTIEFLRDVSARSCGLRHVRIARPLVSLSLHRNMLTSLPDIHFTDRLRSLDLSHNSLTHLDSFPTATFLTELDLSNNQLTRVRFDPKHMPRLNHLHLSNNVIEKFEGELQTHLRTFDLSNNKLKEYYGRWYLHTDLSHNHIRNVILTAGDADDFSTLLLAHNELGSGAGLQTSPGAFYNKIDLSHNGLTGRDAGRLLREQASDLDLSFNAIEFIDPASVAEFFRSSGNAFFSGLRILNLVNNELVNVFDTDIGERLPQLEGKNSLGVDKIAVAPAELRRLSQGLHSANESSSHEIAEIQWIEEDPVTSSTGRRCAYLSSQEVPGLRLYQCECTSDYYGRMVRGRAVGCELCVPFALCKQGRIHCSEGYYLDTSGPKPQCVTCRPMEDGAECYDNMVVPRQGFWKPHENWTSVYECRNEAICGGGTNSTQNCREGHGGSLCSVCDRNFYKTSAALCQECPGVSMSVMYVITMVLGCAVLVVGLAVPGALNLGTSMATSSGKDASIEGASEAATEASGLAKMLIAFMQVLVMFPSVYSVDFGQWLDVISDWFQWLDFDFMSASSVECVYEGLIGSRSEYTFYHSMCLQASIPIIAILLAAAARLVVEGVRMVIRPAAGVTGQQVKGVVGRAAFFGILFVYLPVSTSGSQFFKCTSFDGGATMYVDSDLTLQCYTPEWYAYMPVAVFILVAYSLGLPLLIVTLLAPAGPDVIPSKAGLGWAAGPLGYTVAMMRSMFPVYKTRFAWWEATELLRRLLVTSLAVHYSTSGQLQVTVAMVVSFCALLLHMQCQPFVRADLNTVQTLLLIMLYVNLSVGLLKSLEVEEGVRNWVAAFVMALDGVLMAVMVALCVAKASTAYVRLRRAGDRRAATSSRV